jgi:hypothetical protein
MLRGRHSFVPNQPWAAYAPGAAESRFYAQLSVAAAHFFPVFAEKPPENTVFLPHSVEIRRLQVDHEAVGGFLLLTLSHERKVQ